VNRLPLDFWPDAGWCPEPAVFVAGVIFLVALLVGAAKKRPGLGFFAGMVLALLFIANTTPGIRP
jgi:hypothetical protein